VLNREFSFVWEAGRANLLFVEPSSLCG